MVILASASLTACGGGGQDAAKPSTDSLAIGLDNPGGSLDPAKDGFGAAMVMRSLAYASLTHMEADGSITAGLAESWKYLDGANSRFELILRDDAKFSDGTPVDAQAVKAWLEYFDKTSFLSSALDIKAIDAVDERTVRIELNVPNPDIPTLFSEQYNWGFVASPAAVAKPELLGTETAGAGPYVLDPSKTVEGDHYAFVRNPNYYDKDNPTWETVTVRIIGDPGSLLQAVSTGQVQVAYGKATTADAAKDADLEVVQAPAGTTGLVLADRNGQKVKPLADKRVRQAMNYAVDREAITDALMGDYASPTSTVLTPDGMNDDLRDRYDYDPDRAKALLAEAGYADGFTLNTVTVPASDGPLGEPLAQAVAKYLGEVGIELEIDAATSDAEFAEKVVSGDYSTIEITVESYPTLLLHSFYFAEEAVVNPFKVVDDELDQIIKNGARAKDRESFWQAYSQEVTEDALLLPVFQTDMTFYVTPGIEGVVTTTNARWPVVADWSVND